ncbi:MAG: DinB family protein [Anaerolineaceae bacterium]|nr:DinB family protein [Anaerolineaceae bacterium]
MDSITYLRKQLDSMWSLQHSAVDSVTDEILMRQPAGTASPIGVIWLHLINAQDNFTGILFGDKPLWQKGWAEKFDLAQAPDIGEDWTPYYETPLTVELLRAYGGAVQQFTRETLDGIDEHSLDETVRMFTDQDPKADVWVLMIGHTLLHCGEIAILKGIFGEQGLPF